MPDRQMLDAIQYSLDVPCFSGSYSKNKYQHTNQQKQRIIRQRSQLQQNQYCQIFYFSKNTNCKQRHKKRHNIEQFQKKSQHLLILKVIRIFFLILIMSPIQVSCVLEKQQKQQDGSILAVFQDSYEGHEVELQRMIMDRSTAITNNNNKAACW
jgi:hypothetical protein